MDIYYILYDICTLYYMCVCICRKFSGIILLTQAVMTVDLRIIAHI